jgi:hypothetical protein
VAAAVEGQVTARVPGRVVGGFKGRKEWTRAIPSPRLSTCRDGMSAVPSRKKRTNHVEQILDLRMEFGPEALWAFSGGQKEEVKRMAARFSFRLFFRIDLEEGEVVIKPYMPK